MAIHKYTKKSRNYKRKHKSLKLQKGGGDNLNKKQKQNALNKYKKERNQEIKNQQKRDEEILRKQEIKLEEFLALSPEYKKFYARRSIFGSSYNNVEYPNDTYYKIKSI
jgi:hypothetical protein